ncbi:C45 family peptidase [Nostoc sp. CHAB 5715]|uniref:C45 family autoproteolytic acyltransferase/hydolase n=1 Tax=Nostoc sp. CHAB 5715 TaxID=2780400 RepID=UPI001E58FB60|nr:C45 family peptidase [Nostoc sp. CHAB 5715]MCC5619959.1 C45 family peptidase [Nostoc sp. CHAB 5715]
MERDIVTKTNQLFELPTGEQLHLVPPILVENNKPHLEAKLPLVRLSGSPEAIGAAHGSLLRSRIEKAIAVYRFKLFPDWSDSALKATSLAFFQRIQDFSLPYAIELKAIASHSGRELWEIAMLISRTEILRSTAPNECTAVYFKQGILGQNWDWVADFENLAVIFDITREDGHRFLAMGEPGFVKIGCNTSGIGVCLNILKCDAHTGGIPVHVLLRRVLDSTDIKEAYQAIAKAERATMSNILIANEAGEYKNLELAGSSLFDLSQDEVEVNNIVVHTNGYLTHELETIPNPDETASSAVRLSTAKTLVLNSRTQDEAEMLAILLNQQGALPICRRSEQNPLNNISYGTVATLVMNLKKKIFIFSQGNPLEKTFSFISLT